MAHERLIFQEVKTIVDRCRAEGNRKKVERTIAYVLSKLEPPAWTREDVAEVDRRAREALGLIEVPR